LCLACYQRWETAQRAERGAVKQRRLARQASQNGAVVTAPEPSEPEAAPSTEAPRHKGAHGPGSVGISQEQKDEIVTLYLTTDTSVEEICRTYTVRNTYPYALLKAAGISWRRGDGTPPPPAPGRNGQVTPEVVSTLPEPIEKALERMIERPVEPPRPEQLRSTPPIETGLVPHQPVRQAPSLPEYVEHILPGSRRTWAIEYVGRMLVEADTVDDALAAARADGHLTQIIGVTLRTR
jgi:hypothetical protein